ncbi:MAG TPA: Asp-tRNA(Asn)/Glu-tRNA(Gln) amidotransferase subunit GatA [Thermoanaerobaculia bacterium]|jgi:aspartyl-tRNA(Asn)/glutamyl-tRNA(Gln) amidotransferase subunit A|nr:Asp-tRNA(Asn)/Glu-tRNA(Gln) amidotransferase subunit GatA [Thermoanaerobaculia bacterium]
MSDDFLNLPWTEARGEVSPGEYVAACRRAIVARNPSLNAFLCVSDAAGEGMPIGVKDNIVTTEIPTSCGSRILHDFRSPFDATAIARLRAAGAVVMGKTNLDEFAMGSSTEHSAFGPARNPWDPTRVPGGSSGGSAAAVAARMVPIALGSETGGSVRQPAALCGVVGLKPTYGRVSRKGLVAFASGLDQIGIVSKTVRESAEVLGLIAGHDPGDSTSSTMPVNDYTADLAAGVKGLRLGIVREAVEQLGGEVGANFEAALQTLRDLGAQAEEVSVPSIGYAIAVYYIVANAEASANLSRFDGIRYGHRSARARTLEDVYFDSRGEGFGAEVKRRIMLGTFALSSGYYDAYYGRAQAVRERLREDFRRAFAGVDLLVTPTVPEPAFLIGAKTDDPLAMYLSDIFTAPANLVGIPAIAVPSGFSAEGLPLSLQLMAPHFAERSLFRAASAYEGATAYWRRMPPM